MNKIEQYAACAICHKKIRLAGWFAQKTAIDDGSRLVHKRCNDLRNRYERNRSNKYKNVKRII